MNVFSKQVCMIIAGPNTRVWVSEAWSPKERGQNGTVNLGQSRMTQTLRWKRSQVPASRRVQRRPWGSTGRGGHGGATAAHERARAAGDTTEAPRSATCAGWRVTRGKGRGCTHSTTPFRTCARPSLTSKQTRNFLRSRLWRWPRITSSR